MEDKWLKFDGESIDKRDILCCQHSYRMFMKQFNLYIFNYKGDIKQCKTFDDLIVDFKPLSYSDGYAYCRCNGQLEYSNGWYEMCSQVFLDKDLEPYKEITLLPYGRITADNLLCQCHDSILLSDNHCFLLGAKNVEADVHGKKTFVTDCIIQEQLNDKVIWQFDCLDYPELFDFSIFHNNYDDRKAVGQKEAADYAHLNSITLSSDNKYLYASFRNIGIAKIEYETKKILWIIGKKSNTFNIDEKLLPKFQHDIRLLSDDIFTVFDNAGNDRHARVLKFTIKNGSCTVDEFCTTRQASHAMGGAIQVVDKVFDITYGKCFTLNNILAEELDYSSGRQTARFIIKAKIPKFIFYRLTRGH